MKIKKDFASDTLQKTREKILNAMRSLMKIWHRIEEANCEGVTDFDLKLVSVFVQEEVILAGQDFNCATYISSLSVLTAAETNKQIAKASFRD